MMTKRTTKAFAAAALAIALAFTGQAAMPVARITSKTTQTQEA